MRRALSVFIMSKIHIFLLLSLLVGCSHVGDDHRRVQELIAHSEQMLEVDNIDSAWVLLDSAYVFSTQQNYQSGQAEVLLAMARHHNMMDRMDSAINCLQRGLVVYPSAPDSLLAQYYAELSATYNYTGDMRASVEWAHKALPLMKLYGSDEDYAIFCGNTGIAYRRLGKNDSAAILYQQGLDVAVATANHEGEAYLANNLSVLFAEMGRYSESIEYAEKAAGSAALADDNVERLSAEANKGVALLLDKRTDEAITVLIPTFEQADSTNSTPLKLKTINYLLKALSERPMSAQTTYYLRRGEELASQLPSGNTGAAGILEAKMLILTEQGRYAEAMKAIAEIEKLMTQQIVIPRHKLLSCKSRCLAAQGNFSQAYQLQREAMQLSDSLHSRENAEKLDELATNYRVMEKELQVAKLSRKQALNQRSISLLLVALIFLSAVIGGLLLWMRQRRQRQQMRETQRYVEGIEQERSRFAHELHDGACNELLAMGMQLRSDHPDVPEVCRQITTLRTHLRQLSHELMPPQFTHGVHLNEAVRYYLLHLEGYTITFHEEGEEWGTIPPNVSYQYYRIIQEAIGNMIVHQPTAEAGVSLIYKQGVSLQLLVTSTGDYVKKDGSGIGLQSMNDRAESIGGHLDVTVNETTWQLKVNLE